MIRPSGDREAAVHEDNQQFNDDVYVGDLEMLPSDGTKQMCKAMVDERAALGILIPMNSSRVVGGEESCRAIEEHWITWAGPPKRLHYGLTKGHQGVLMEEMASRHGVKLEAVPGEAWKQKGKVEKRIDLYKAHFVKLNHEVSLTKDDKPRIWTTRLS